MSVFNILIVIAAGLAIASLVKPSWPLTPVAVLLIAIALLTK